MNDCIKDRIARLRAELPSDVELVAVSKYYPAEDVLSAYECGQRIFGESRVQELCEKRAVLPQDIKWHFIGHLQPNKVKYIAPFIDLIHAVDSLKLLAEIDKQGRKCNRIIPCLLQLHVAQEESKFGFGLEECYALLQNSEWREYAHAKICGVMCMATNVDDEGIVHAEFQKAKEFYKKVKEDFFPDDDSFCRCSWGMSGDYRIAIEEGANLVRIGSMIFEG